MLELLTQLKVALASLITVLIGLISLFTMQTLIKEDVFRNTNTETEIEVFLGADSCPSVFTSATGTKVTVSCPPVQPPPYLVTAEDIAISQVAKRFDVCKDKIPESIKMSVMSQPSVNKNELLSKYNTLLTLCDTYK